MGLYRVGCMWAGVLLLTVSADGWAGEPDPELTYAEKLLGHASWPRQELDETHPAMQAATGVVTAELVERARDLLLARIAEG